MQPSNSNETIATAPAPWNLTGSGLVLLYKFPTDFIQAHGFLPAEGIGRYVGGYGCVILVDYTRSDVGSYHELLFIPGKFTHPAGTFYSITKIYVSSMDSVINGQQNWGIPKEVADFTVAEAEKGRRVTTLARDGKPFAEIAFRPYGLTLPVTTAIIPKGWRTLIQHQAGRTLLTAPGASSGMRLAHVDKIQIDPTYFPDITPFKPTLALSIPRFKMQFPVATVIDEAKP